MFQKFTSFSAALSHLRQITYKPRPRVLFLTSVVLGHIESAHSHWVQLKVVEQVGVDDETRDENRDAGDESMMGLDSPVVEHWHPQG